MVSKEKEMDAKIKFTLFLDMQIAQCDFLIAKEKYEYMVNQSDHGNLIKENENRRKIFTSIKHILETRLDWFIEDIVLDLHEYSFEYEAWTPERTLINMTICTFKELARMDRRGKERKMLAEKEMESLNKNLEEDHEIGS